MRKCDEPLRFYILASFYGPLPVPPSFLITNTVAPLPCHPQPVETTYAEWRGGKSPSHSPCSDSFAARHSTRRNQDTKYTLVTEPNMSSSMLLATVRG
jgi:hypothetical protein